MDSARCKLSSPAISLARPPSTCTAHPKTITSGTGRSISDHSPLLARLLTHATPADIFHNGVLQSHPNGLGTLLPWRLALRPEIPNSGAVQRTLIQYVEDLHCKPPYHPHGLVPMQYAKTHFTAVDAINLTLEQRFLYRRKLRQTWHKNGALNLVSIPAAPN